MRNQRIEGWSHFRRQHSSWWIDFFNDLQESDILDLTNQIHTDALWFCFANILQDDLDKVKDYWNSHCIRKSKYGTMSGVPDMMYFQPEEFGRSDCLVPVFERLREMEHRLQELGVDDHSDPIWEECLLYVMERMVLHSPLPFLRQEICFKSLFGVTKARGTVKIAQFEKTSRF